MTALYKCTIDIDMTKSSLTDRDVVVAEVAGTALDTLPVQIPVTHTGRPVGSLFLSALLLSGAVFLNDVNSVATRRPVRRNYQHAEKHAPELYSTATTHIIHVSSVL